MDKTTLDAGGVYYRQFNEQIRAAVAAGSTDFELLNVRGQRYIADALDGEINFLIHGVPGQDMGAFMRGPKIRVEGNAQDGVGNTMDDGEIVINGLAGDVLGYAMRGGRIMVKNDVGYRVGIHMKAYKEKVPVVVIGGKAGDFLGEYMAGGAIILLGMFTGKPEAPIAGRSLGTGMHGGVIYVRGEVPLTQLGPHLKTEAADAADLEMISKHVAAFADAFGLDSKAILAEPFVRVKPFSHRPYGNLYVAA
jgi:glutamate synthase domain-containing protein 3